MYLPSILLLETKKITFNMMNITLWQEVPMKSARRVDLVETFLVLLMHKDRFWTARTRQIGTSHSVME